MSHMAQLPSPSDRSARSVKIQHQVLGANSYSSQNFAVTVSLSSSSNGLRYGRHTRCPHSSRPPDRYRPPPDAAGWRTIDCRRICTPKTSTVDREPATVRTALERGAISLWISDPEHSLGPSRHGPVDTMYHRLCPPQGNRRRSGRLSDVRADHQRNTTAHVLEFRERPAVRIPSLEGQSSNP